MNQHDLPLEDRLEAAYTACHAPVAEVLDDIRQAIRERLEARGFMVDLVKRPGTDRETVLVYFDIDRMLSIEQVRDGIIRNRSDAMRYVERGKSIVAINMELAGEYGMSCGTIESIRWREK